MSTESEIERLIASIAERTPIDWEAAPSLAGAAAEQGRLAALRGIERIAAFSHARWQQVSALPEPTREAGETLGAYTLEWLIGQGGMGEVWCARRSDGRFEGRAAIKLLHLPLVARHGRGRFLREGQILARLRHPHIAQLLDAGISEAGQPYLVLEFVDGVPIDRYCEAQQLDLRARLRLFLDALAAVAYAQANLVLHRDLKPSNLLVNPAGEVKLLDFGVAKLMEDESAAPESELTRRVGHAFTPEYAAPEQLQGLPVSTATDVYSAGVLLYLLLTGSHPTPLAPGTLFERMRAALESEPRPASAVATASRRRDLRGDLDKVLAKALKKSPAERYANVADFAADLRRYLDQQPVTARADTLGYRMGKFVRRHRGAVAGASAAALALAALSVWALWERGDARRQRDEAEHQRDAAEEQTRLAEAFTSVVTSLLSQVGPGGRALTPVELLDRAVGELEARYRDEPAFLVDMLIRISGRYFDLQNTEKELATLVRAESAARQAGDPDLLFDVQVNTVETELAAGHQQAARARMAEARGLLPQLHRPPDMDAYLRAEARLARAAGDVDAAVGFLQRARALMEGAGSTHGNAYPGILSELSVCQYLAGDVRGAYATTLAIVEIDRQHGRALSQPGLISRALLAGGLYDMGEVRHARERYEEIVPGIGGSDTHTAPSIALRYGEILGRLGAAEAGIRLIEGALTAAETGGNELLADRARLALVRTLLRAGRSADARRRLGEAETALLAEAEGHRAWLAEASRLRAELQLVDGHAAEARPAAAAALRLHRYPEVQQDLWLPAAVLTQARVQLAGGEGAAALVSAEAALALFERDASDPAQSADVGEALLVLAQAQQAAGDSGSARRSAARAADCLRSGLGADHPLARQAAAIAAGG